MIVFRYTLVDKGIQVERAGRVDLLPGEDHKQKAIGLICSTQLLPKHVFEVQLVDSLETDIITSTETPKKR